MSKKTVWFEVEENETIDDCLKRMADAGYMPMGRREEPIFHEVDGKPVHLRQKIQFKGIHSEE
ncbi:NETI motif-containing protein [Planomicrobium sp. YIM 101495]|uniref:NETI motif-containing protein n=1 Tax=Planomicrobium sp. YIM 101495 TaxID=2665160 RepID=UPI0012B988EE|nr:NETI motif-containing protein [Planomicrobium sp. YIM 101495]MTD32030.1 NETI motif-containing protein [Planomicrobium sp. YIM 101495]